MLREWLEASRRQKILYFVNSRRRCDDVYLTLRGAPPYEAFVHYSTLTKEQREYVERSFKSSTQAICVATGTLELGIDIGSIDEIVLVDPPMTVSSFLQRIGRGGRRGPYSSVVLTPQGPLDLLQFVALLSLAGAAQVEAAPLTHPYSVLVQQIFSFIAGKRRLNLHIDELLELFARYSWLDRVSLGLVLEGLVAAGFLRSSASGRLYEVGPALETLIDRHQIYSNILDAGGGIQVFHHGRLLAQLPLLRSQMGYGNTLLFAGRYWRITSVTDDGVTVELAKAVPNPIRPNWSSRGSFSASRLLAQKMRAVLEGDAGPQLSYLDGACVALLADLRRGIPGAVAGGVWYERVGDRWTYYTFAGATENQILGLLFDQAGMPCRPASRAEGVALIAPHPLDFNALPRDAGEVEATIVTNWRHFASQVTAGPYFANLPATLRRHETVVQIATPETLRVVTSLHGVLPVSVKLGLL